MTVRHGGVVIGSGSAPDQPNADVIVLEGSTSDSVTWLGVPHPAARLVFGEGDNRLTASIGAAVPEVWEIAAGDRSLSIGGQVVMRWEGTVTDFAFGGPVAPTRLVFVGTGRDESVFVNGRATVHMRGGDDRVFYEDGMAPRRSVLSGGPGRDTLDAQHLADDPAHPTTLFVDLDEHVLRFGGSTPTRIHGFEDLVAWSARVVAVGNENDNRLFTRSCDLTVHGAGGRDRITTQVSAQFACDDFAFRLEGGPGRDTLTGSNRDDVLIGGPGRDTANGLGGVDTCRAEVTRSCELT